MTKDRQKLGILIVLLGVLAATSLMGYRMKEPTTTAAVQTPAAKTSANPPSPSDARILLELVEKDSGAKGNIGDRNLFQYRQAPPPPISRTPVPALPGAIAAQPTQAPIQAPPTRPPAQPVLPPIPLKYQGYASRNGSGQGLTAFLADDARHYNVTVGEVLMGKYRISSITDKSVEVEDLENNRRQTLPLLN